MLLSKSAYARHMGVSRQTVYGWIARGEIVISGDKVDVDASQAKQNGAGAGAGAGAGDRHNAMTWAQAAAWVWGHDSGKELPADINAGQRIEAAAAELGFDVQHEPEEELLILFRLDEETHSFYGKDHMAGGLRFLRSELAYVAAMHPDTQDDWSDTGLKALCLLAGEKL
ncbi:DNA-binding protein [Enterobacter roggenkampii]|uniref:DNA-binding protein n=1 Tax=Enterobacter roggenkampii TaxID=1812935 RepID=UPI001D0C277F|nr:DNA-binding protein [Enterobacter roggenkampii]